MVLKASDGNFGGIFGVIFVFDTKQKAKIA